MSFYVTLTSNSSSHLTNNGGHFVSVLPREIFLDKSWRVGLVEIIYRRDFPNVRDNENVISLQYAKNVPTYQKAQVLREEINLMVNQCEFYLVKDDKRKTFTLTASSTSTLADFVFILKETIGKILSLAHGHEYQFDINVSSDLKIEMRFSNFGGEIQMNKQLQEILGGVEKIKTLKTITVKIGNTFATNPLPFESGVILKLHFEKESI